MRSILAVLITGAIVASCGGGPATVASSAPAASAASAAPTATPLVPIKLKAAYSNITVDYLPMWIAQEAGIFKKNGLDVELLSVDGGSRAMSTLIANEIQVSGVGGAETLSANAGGTKVIITMILTPVYPYKLMARKGIDTPADLKGKKIGISSVGGSADIATRKALQDMGLDPDKDVILLTFGAHAQRTAALIAGAIDAEVDDPPATTILEKQGFHVIYDLAAKKLPSVQTSIAATGAWLATNKEAMQRFTDAIVESLAFGRKNKAEATKILRKYFKNENDPGFDEAVDYYFGSVATTLPFPRAELFADTQAVLSKTNERVKTLDVKTVFDASFVQSAADRGVDKR